MRFFVSNEKCTFSIVNKSKSINLTDNVKHQKHICAEIIAGWIRKMLRNPECSEQSSLCWKDCFQEAAHQTEPKRKNDSRNSNSSIS